MTPRKIAILFHERHRGFTLNYHVQEFAQIWREEGHEVVELFGVNEFVPADLLFVHVDLSVVPEEYLRFGRRYPIVLNGRLRDIRKSSFSKIRLQLGDIYDGKVIVKSDLNYAGKPERFVGASHQIREHGIMFTSPMEYRVFESIRDVPESVFTDPLMIVERFMPEITEDGKYVMRAMQFLGNQVDCVQFVSDTPIVNGSTGTLTGLVEPHPEMLAARKRMYFDYGKFDYVLHNGHPILLDTNKTVGAGIPNAPEDILAARRKRADGIYDYF